MEPYGALMDSSVAHYHQAPLFSKVTKAFQKPFRPKRLIIVPSVSPRIGPLKGLYGALWSLMEPKEGKVNQPDLEGGERPLKGL